MTDRLRSATPPGEALRYTATLRDGGEIGFTDERLLVAGDERVTIPLENVDAITVQSYDWFVAVMSVLLVAFGVVSLQRNVLAGLAFGAAGVASVYLTYRRRGKVTVKTHSRPKPVVFYPEETDAFTDAADAALDRYEAELAD